MKTKRFSKILERDIDILLAEELAANVRFHTRLFSKAFGTPLTQPKRVLVWHSLSQAGLGESDLVCVATFAGGLRRALLIENKISAAAQPTQSRRYQKRGQAGEKQGHWNSFRTCLVAPRHYLETNSSADGYDYQLSYEELGAVGIKGIKDSPARAAFRLGLLKAAIEQGRRGYNRVPDPSASRFWNSYWEFANSTFPALRMKNPGRKPARSDWPKFWPKGLPRGALLIHKMSQGRIDLQLKGYANRLRTPQRALSHHSKHKYEILAAGKSGIIRCEAPAVDRTRPFLSQRSKIRSCLRKAVELGELASALKLDQHPLSANPPPNLRPARIKKLDKNRNQDDKKR